MREQGFYWVRINIEFDKAVAYWTGTAWFFICNPNYYEDDDIYEIFDKNGPLKHE